MGVDEAQEQITLLLAAYNNKLLNNMEPFDSISPTPENIAKTLYSQIKGQVQGHADGKSLWVKGLKVWVSPTQYVWYSEPPGHER